MGGRKKAKIWPAAESGHEDENVFDQTDFGFDEAHGLGDSAILFGADEQEDPADWGVGGDGDAGSDLFSTGGVDAPEWAMTARKKRHQGGGLKDRSTHEGGKSSQRTAPVSGGETRDAYSRGLGESRRERPEQHMPSDDDDDDDDDDEEVAFGQDDSKVHREKEEREEAERVHIARLAKQIHALMERVGELKAQAKKARQEATAHQEENKELKSRVEQMREDQNDLMLAQARIGLTGGINRTTARNPKNERDLDAEMRKRRLAKNALLAGVQTEEEEDLVITLEGISTSTLAQLSGRFYRWLGKKLPLGADVRAIQARYGSAVASYFHFYRWLVGSYILLASPSLVWIVFHLLDQGSAAIFNVSLIGIIPSFMAYSSFDSSNQTLYAVMVVLTTAAQVFSATVKWIREDKIRKELYIVDEEQKHVQFAKMFLVGWDNSLTNDQEVEDLRLSNGLAAANMLAEISQADVAATRSLDDRIKLYAHRCFGFALYVALQMGAWAAILILTAESDNLAIGLAEQLQSVPWLTRAAATISTSIVPATVTIINAIMPIIIKAITNLEKWDMERTVTYMLTSRMFLAKILNAFIQAFSYLLLSNPYLLAGSQYSELRARVEQTFDPSGYSCRLDQAGAGLFQLVVTEFIFSKIINYATLRAAQFKAKWSRKLFVKPEFEVAKRMVGLLYFQALILAAYPFFPMGTLFITPFLILSFKFEKMLLTTFQSKPKGRLKAHDGYSFFIKFYLFTLVLLGVMVTLFLVGSATFAKQCSIQDDVANLCGEKVIVDDSTCAPLSADNTYYKYFSEQCEEEGYPACLCKGDLACGPFVEVVSAYNALNLQLRSVSVLGILYGYLIDYSLVVWCLAITLWLTILFQRNSAQTHADAAADREREWMNEAQATQARLKKQAKLIEKMQLQAGALLFDDDGS